MKPEKKRIAAAFGLIAAMLAGGLISFITEIAFTEDSLAKSALKPLLSMATLSVFPFLIVWLHPEAAKGKFWGFAALLAFIGWDAVARTAYYAASRC